MFGAPNHPLWRESRFNFNRVAFWIKRRSDCEHAQDARNGDPNLRFANVSSRTDPATVTKCRGQGFRKRNRLRVPCIIFVHWQETSGIKPAGIGEEFWIIQNPPVKNRYGDFQNRDVNRERTKSSRLQLFQRVWSSRYIHHVESSCVEALSYYLRKLNGLSNFELKVRPRGATGFHLEVSPLLKNMTQCL